MTSSVIVSLRIAAPPHRVFAAFTENIGQWWVQNPLFQLTPSGDGTLRFEPGEGGRLITTLPNGTEFEIGRITIWRPGEHLALTWRHSSFAADQSTDLEIRFEPIGDVTRITIEHRGWDKLPQEHAARHGFPLLLFERREVDHWRALLGGLAKTLE